MVLALTLLKQLRCNVRLGDYLHNMLISLLGDPQLVIKWWTTPNAAFNGQCPQDVDENTIKNYLESHCFR
jgi:hypothetical protein